ncbi:MAG: hypothetical protein FWG10_11065 [Eubacteriaceae bacterium]|nr:hypothetical protein [Eubacteriaceae bacterium]
MNVLFWNAHRTTHKENIDNCIIEITKEKDCDLVVLAEYDEPLDDLCSILNTKFKNRYKPLPNNKGCDKIKGIVKNKFQMESIQEQSRYQIVKIETTLYKLILG